MLRFARVWLVIGDDAALKSPAYEVNHQVDNESDEKEREDNAKSSFHLCSMNLPPLVKATKVDVCSTRGSRTI